MVKTKEDKINRKRKDITALFMLLVIVVLINFVSHYFFKRIDLTSEKRYTLAASTKEMLKKVDEEILFKVYLEGNFNPGFTRLRNEAREILDEFRAYSNENIQYEFINPAEEGLTLEEKNSIQKQLFEKGIIPEEIIEKKSDKTSNLRIWPGAIASYKGREAVWQIYSHQALIGVSSEQSINNSVQELEYSLSNTIRKLQRDRKPEVTFLDGHNELDTISRYDFARSLSEYYSVNRTLIKQGVELESLKGTDALIIAKPDSSFTDKEKFIIDQFIMEGGKVLWLIDPVTINMDTLNLRGFSIGLNRPLNLEDMLFKYGVRLNPVLVQDMQCGMIPINIGFKKGQANIKMFPWVHTLWVLPDVAHPIVKNLDVIKMEYVSNLDTVTAHGIKKTVLLRSSRNSRIQPTPARIALQMATLPVKESQFKDGSQMLALLLEGEFTSFAENRLPTILRSNPDFKFLEHGKKTKMIVVADGDIAANDYQRSTGQVMPLGYDKYSRQVFANKTFLLNCVNYLLDDEGMLQLRSREVKLRMLDKKKLKLQRTKWQMINVVYPIILIALLGTVQFYVRRKKYGV
ncbi:MAG: gliding motility-associated ABC transporter substrate-binding protein GldG [Sphingobacteriaceae bacterium]|nr:gliding motility-associated ABC transporter substrate-binding protein GldG [Sphingobacteriaceae bacterium]